MEIGVSAKIFAIFGMAVFWETTICALWPTPAASNMDCQSKPAPGDRSGIVMRL